MVVVFFYHGQMLWFLPNLLYIVFHSHTQTLDQALVCSSETGYRGGDPYNAKRY